MVKFDIVDLCRKTKLKPKHLNKKIKIYNGKIYHEFLITKSMIKFKIGSFSSTRKAYNYIKK